MPKKYNREDLTCDRIPAVFELDRKVYVFIYYGSVYSYDVSVKTWMKIEISLFNSTIGEEVHSTYFLYNSYLINYLILQESWRINKGICDEKSTRTGRFFTKVAIDGKTLGIVCNNYNPLEFHNVKVWAAMQNSTKFGVYYWGQWQGRRTLPAANAKIRNLLINGEKITIH